MVITSAFQADDVGSIPITRSNFNLGDMVKLVNTADLKSAAERLVGSIPTIPTKF
jgi:hypothetical protein